MHGQAGVPDWTRIFNNWTDDCAVEAQAVSLTGSTSVDGSWVQVQQ